MIRAVIVFLAVAQATACATTATHPLRDLFGVTTGMRKSAVHEILGKAGTFVREERKRQEVWTVRDDRFEGAIVGYDAEGRVRFITAVAKKDGTPVRYDEVLDIAGAEHQSVGTTHNYRWHRRGYDIVAIGNDPERLTYLTLKRSGEEDEEEEEDEE